MKFSQFFCCQNLPAECRCCIAAPVIVQGVNDSYTATATYQQPVVITAAVPLNDISEARPHATVSAESESPSVNLRHHHHQQQQQQGDGVSLNRSTYEEHHYSEINSEPPSASSTSSPTSSATAMAMATTSSGHVTETDTPTGRPHAVIAAYSGLDTSTMDEPVWSPSVYQTLNDADQVSSSTLS